MKLFEQFKKTKQLLDETEFVRVYKCISHNKEYRIVITKKRANFRSVIHCIDNYIAWEQVPFFFPQIVVCGDRVPIYKFSEDKNVVTVFVVKGEPKGISGLDVGMFRSANRFDGSCVNVMSYSRFKEI